MPTPPTETYTIEPDTIEPGEAAKTEQNNNSLILLAVAVAGVVAVAVATRCLCKTGQDAATKDADTKDFGSQVDSNGGVLGGSVEVC